jgi:hypothetical protein
MTVKRKNENCLAITVITLYNVFLSKIITISRVVRWIIIKYFFGICPPLSPGRAGMGDLRSLHCGGKGERGFSETYKFRREISIGGSFI